ncbi:hypothetical protein BX600DRAFT_21316 [Xylariales sp. PMI_506]|nr:hypothetical protein BX600DRAFT_21316 [Xylariales sp. PMI_506]
MEPKDISTRPEGSVPQQAAMYVTRVNNCGFSATTRGPGSFLVMKPRLSWWFGANARRQRGVCWKTRRRKEETRYMRVHRDGGKLREERGSRKSGRTREEYGKDVRVQASRTRDRAPGKTVSLNCYILLAERQVSTYCTVRVGGNTMGLPARALPHVCSK